MPHHLFHEIYCNTNSAINACIITSPAMILPLGLVQFAGFRTNGAISTNGIHQICRCCIIPLDHKSDHVNNHPLYTYSSFLEMTLPLPSRRIWKDGMMVQINYSLSLFSCSTISNCNNSHQQLPWNLFLSHCGHPIH